MDTVGEMMGDLRFNGPVYSKEFDQKRLTGQIKRVYGLMMDAEWRTLDEISRMTNDPHASVSAQLRHLRKKRFGGYIVEKRPRGDRHRGLWEYRLLVNVPKRNLTFNDL